MFWSNNQGINGQFIIILKLTIAFNLGDWPEGLPPYLGHDHRSVLLLSSSIALFIWMVSLLEGSNSWVFLSTPSMVSVMLHAFLNTRSPMFNSLFCTLTLFGPHKNHSHNALFKCSPQHIITTWLFGFLNSGAKIETLSNFKSFQFVMLPQYLNKHLESHLLL